MPTTDGLWVVWAYKLARPEGNRFVPLTGPPGYPAVARAFCRSNLVRRAHDAPDPECTCGFHAVSNRDIPMLPLGDGFVVLTVALYGRVLAFEWAGGGVLWRAEQQTVVRVQRPDQFGWPGLPGSARVDRTPSVLTVGGRRRPDDPDGRLAVVRPSLPRDSGPIRLTLPVSAPALPVCHDDAGWCVAATTPVEHAPAALAAV